MVADGKQQIAHGCLLEFVDFIMPLLYLAFRHFFIEAMSIGDRRRASAAVRSESML
jgi:hypothetical protein